MLYSVEYRDHSEEGGGAARYCAVCGVHRGSVVKR